MFDAGVRRVLAPTLDAVAGRLVSAGLSALTLTITGWVAGVAACVAAGLGWWPAALALWLLNRLLDGLDGPVARRRGATDLGGFLDILADFSVYAGFVVGVAVAVPDARVACLALLTAYYVSGAALLALSSLLDKRGPDGGDGRSLRLAGGVAEGTETVVVYVLFCVFPGSAALIAWVFATAVAVTAAQRIALGVRLLRQAVRADRPSPSHPRSDA